MTSLIFFALLGITFASARIGLMGGDPKTWSPDVVAVVYEEFIPDDFVVVVCPPKKNFSWLQPFW